MWSIKIYNLDGEEICNEAYDSKIDLYKAMSRYIYRYDVGFGIVGEVKNGVWNVMFSYRPNYVGWNRGLRL